jgi:hypothetical protein
VGDNLCSERGPGSVKFRADCGDVFAEADCVDARPSSVLEFVDPSSRAWWVEELKSSSPLSGTATSRPTASAESSRHSR